MQIEFIDTFIDLCETRSFNRTADRLNVTQSTISGRVRALEAAVGARLFERSRSGTMLTTEGLRFEPYARDLRHGWSEALHATRSSGDSAMTLRIGIQNDLIGVRFSELIRGFQNALPEAAFFFETDYSTQMTQDLVSGAQDVAILFTPRPHPDIHYESVGEVTYVMVSTEAERLADVAARKYILGNYSPAFMQSHAALLPSLVAAPLSIGQNAAMVSLIGTIGGTAFVLAQSATELIAAGTCRTVADAPAISQSVHAGVHLRNRHRPVFRRLLQVLREDLFLTAKAPRRRQPGARVT